MKLLSDKGYCDLKPSLGAVLIPLFDNNTQCITDIMTFSKLSKQTMTSYVRELNNKGYINTDRDKNDKRRVVVSLTAKGKKLHLIANEAVRQVNHEFCKDLNTAEFKHFIQLINRMISR